ncbi:serine hydrolase domain-containing protein [Sandaracinus amylolyticus]|uniref:serine hydrolase domain-containing protein n=1 Tax=Sandaracinus amylolyticus TaxID=927083 RepID=UPI001F3C50F3|nr:serine hydrolase [Sandaracinus amylolyticus]UJR81935.1 Beta-lactamase [Sandaracinus amylolyticus]
MRLPYVALLALSLAACGDLGLASVDASVPTDAITPPAIDATPFDGGPPPADLEGFVDWHMRAGGIRGLAAAITTRDGTALTLLRGEASEGIPVAEDTLFVLASISKTFTGILVVQLVEDGLLDLDAPLDDDLPYAVRNPAFPDVPVTARMLLTHTSGLRDQLTVLGMASTAGTDPDIALSDFVRDYVAVADHWSTRPGTRYEYTNAGFAVLGALVEAITQQDFRARSDARLLDPFGLDGAGWFLADVDVSLIATPYAWSERRGFTALQHGGYAFYPASSMRASIAHMARYARAVSRGLEIDGTRVLSAELATEMRRVPFPEIAGDRALAWEIETIRGRAYMHHSGATNGGATLLYVGDDGVSIIVLTNSDAYIRSRLGMREGADALREIVLRLDTEADTLVRE